MGVDDTRVDVSEGMESHRLQDYHDGQSPNHRNGQGLDLLHCGVTDNDLDHRNDCVERQENHSSDDGSDGYDESAAGRNGNGGSSSKRTRRQIDSALSKSHLSSCVLKRNEQRIKSQSHKTERRINQEIGERDSLDDDDDSVDPSQTSKIRYRSIRNIRCIRNNRRATPYPSVAQAAPLSPLSSATSTHPLSVRTPHSSPSAASSSASLSSSPSSAPCDRRTIPTSPPSSSPFHVSSLHDDLSSTEDSHSDSFNPDDYDADDIVDSRGSTFSSSSSQNDNVGAGRGLDCSDAVSGGVGISGRNRRDCDSGNSNGKTRFPSLSPPAEASPLGSSSELSTQSPTPLSSISSTNSDVSGITGLDLDHLLHHPHPHDDKKAHENNSHNNHLERNISCGGAIDVNHNNDDPMNPLSHLTAHMTGEELRQMLHLQEQKLAMCGNSQHNNSIVHHGKVGGSSVGRGSGSGLLQMRRLGRGRRILRIQQNRGGCSAGGVGSDAVVKGSAIGNSGGIGGDNVGCRGVGSGGIGVEEIDRLVMDGGGVLVDGMNSLHVADDGDDDAQADASIAAGGGLNEFPISVFDRSSRHLSRGSIENDSCCSGDRGGYRADGTCCSCIGDEGCHHHHTRPHLHHHSDRHLNATEHDIDVDHGVDELWNDDVSLLLPDSNASSSRIDHPTTTSASASPSRQVHHHCPYYNHLNHHHHNQLHPLLQHAREPPLRSFSRLCVPMRFRHHHRHHALNYSSINSVTPSSVTSATSLPISLHHHHLPQSVASTNCPSVIIEKKAEKKKNRKRKREIASIDIRQILRCLHCDFVEVGGFSFGDYVVCSKCGSNDFDVVREWSPTRDGGGGNLVGGCIGLRKGCNNNTSNNYGAANSNRGTSYSNSHEDHTKDSSISSSTPPQSSPPPIFVSPSVSSLENKKTIFSEGEAKTCPDSVAVCSMDENDNRSCDTNDEVKDNIGVVGYHIPVAENVEPLIIG